MLAIRRPGCRTRPPVVALLVCAFIAPATLHADDLASYRLGVFPHLPPRDLEKVFAPLAGDLGKVVDRKIILTSSTTFDKFAVNLDDEKYDIAFVQPFDYIRVAYKHGYLPIASRTEKLSTIIVTLQDSSVKTLGDLRGKKLALPPEPAAVSRLARAYLRQHGINPERDLQINYYRTHFSCMQQVVIGEADACGTALPARRYFQGKYNVSLRIVGQTREIPHALWIVSKRLPRADREKIRKRILEWPKTAEGKRMLENGRLKPFVKVTDADYDIVREIAAQPISK